MDVFDLRDNIVFYNLIKNTANKFNIKTNIMNNIDLKIYVDDAMKTLTALSIDFITIIKNIEANQKDANFIRSKLNSSQLSFRESIFIDNILIEYLGTNISSVIDSKQFDNKRRKDREISDYDVLKLATRISGKEKILNAKQFSITKIREIHKKIDYNKLVEIKKIRDQHYSHIDRKRKDGTDILVKDIVDITSLFLKMFDEIYKAIKGKSIYDFPVDYQLFDLKLKSFKYDMMMKYLSESKNPELNILKSMDQYDTFEDSYKNLFSK